MAVAPVSFVLGDSITKLEGELAARYGEGQRERVYRGLRQVAEFWRPEDGDAGSLEQFVLNNFAGTQEAVDTIFARFELLLQRLESLLQQILRDLRKQTLVVR